MKQLIAKNILLLAFSGLFVQSCQLLQKKGESITLTTKLDSLSYSMGVSIASDVKKQGIDSMNVAALTKGIQDVYSNGKPLLTEADAGRLITEYFQSIQSKKSEKARSEGDKFLAENKSRAGVVTLPSGLQYTVVKEGSGPKPALNSKVKVHYRGTFIDGKVFDSSIDRGEPAVFPVGGVIKGWTEALQLMNVGSKWKLFIPSDLAYGERGAGNVIPPHAALLFDVELLGIEQ